MSILKTIQKAIDRSNELNYEYIYWAIDLHGTILLSDYKESTPVLINKDSMISVLIKLSDSEKHKLILFTSSHDKYIDKVLNYFKWNHNIIFDYINCNPEVKNTKLLNFDKKFYFNILIDDKAGFDPNIDWELINNYLDI